MHISDREVVILATEWQKFDHGEVVEIELPVDVTLSVGDTICWSVAQFDGICRVVEIIPPSDSRIVSVRKC